MVAPPPLAGPPPPRAPDAPIAVDLYDARALADYGEAPAKWWMTPLYAWRVLTRRPAVRRMLAGCKDELARAQARVEDSLVAFAERVRPVVERNPAHARALADVYTAEEILRSRDTALAAEMDAHRGRLALIDARIAAAETDLMTAEDVERKIADELARVMAVRERAEAKMRRAEIEIRNANAVLETCAGGGASGGAGGSAGSGGGAR